MTFQWLLTSRLALSMMCLVIACSDKKESDSSDDDPIPDGKGRIVGVVSDAEGIGVEGVSVAYGDAAAETDFAGGFQIDVSPGTGVIRFSKTGYTEAAMPVVVIEGAPVPVEEGILKRRDPVTLNVDDGGTVGEDAKATVAPGALVDSDGTPATGEVSAYITPIDVMSDLKIAPGDFSATTAEGGDTQLETLAMADYHFEDADGNRLNVAEGASVTVEMAVPPELNASVGDQIPAWSFDVETGKWIEEGMGEVVEDADGNLVWRAEVEHFSWWNADVPIDERDCISGTVTDCNGDPVPGTSVKAQGVDYRGESVAYPSAAGTYCVDIKRGASVDLVVMGSVNGQMVGRREQLTGADAGASCEEGGGCTPHDIALPCDPAESDLDCRDSALLPCDSCISGRVLSPSGDPIENAIVTLKIESSGFKATATTNASGEFHVSAPLDATATLIINAAGYPPHSKEATATVKGQCPGGDSVGDITLPEKGTSTGNLFEDCNLSEVSLTNVDLDGADPVLEELPHVGMMIFDLMGARSGYLWMSDATDPENLLGTHTIYIMFQMPEDGAPGTAELTGMGTYNSGGIIGVNGELYMVSSGNISWNEAVTGGGQTLTGNFDFQLDTQCGMAARNMTFEGTFSTTIVGIDLIGMDSNIESCMAFTSLISAYTLTEGYGVLTVEIDGTPMSITEGYGIGAYYTPSSSQLALTGYGNDSNVFSLVQDAPLIGTQNITQLSYFDSVNQCNYLAEDIPSLTIESAGANDLSEGPIIGGFEATLEDTSGSCAEPSVDISGEFQAAICNL